MDQKCPQPPENDEIELRPDGWDRFERAVDIAARTPAVHRTKPPTKKLSVVKDKRKQ